MKKVLSLFLALIILFNTAVFTAGAEEVHDDVFDVIGSGVATSENLLKDKLSQLHNDGGVGYGFEWYIIALLRAGKDIEAGILDEYYQSVCAKATTFTEETKPTDIARTALALEVMGKDITDVSGKDLASLLYNNERLSDGSNELAYALLALGASGVEIPENALWSKTGIVTEILKFQNEDGSFALNKGGNGDADVTSYCLQALASYREEETIATAVESALAFLKTTVTEKYTVSDNVYTTAQVLFALATLDIDVTNPENGFGDSDNNIIKALGEFRNPNGSGYLYGQNADAAATYQVMQAYDAYRKAHKEDVSYWDFTTDGAKYDDETADGEQGGEGGDTAAKDAIVYVTIATDGDIVTGKDGKHVAQSAVTVSDINKDGKLTVDETLFAAHETYYDGGAENGYISAEGIYGLSIVRLWGRGDAEAATSAGYWKNNASCWSLEDEVFAGDYVTAFNYYDLLGWSDAYSYFANSEVKISAGESAELELKYSGYDEFWNPVVLPCADAKIKFVNCENAPAGEFETDADGKVSVAFSENVPAGDYYAAAYKDDKSIVPSVCRITVEENQGGGAQGSGGNTEKITAHIKVSDPQGETYLDKTGYLLNKGATAYTLLKMTGLKIVTEKTAYGTYVKSIEGLGEFDEGNKSGWMYSVNGSFLEYSLDSYVLSNGDYIKLIYTRDYGADIGGGFRAEEEKTDEKTEETAEKDAEVFVDVSADDWYYEAVNYVSEKSLMKGTGKGFEPNGKMTRAMLVTVLWRLDNEPETEAQTFFEDVKAGEWYSDALYWAYNEKIVSGISDKLFGTNDNITREQLVTMLYRYKKDDTADADESILSAYTDGVQVSAYAKKALSWAIDAGVVKGVEEKILAPQNTATRAEVATMLMRFCKVTGK